MLQVADVTKLRCNFVSDVYEYFNSKKYELHCNNSTAIQSYLDFKLGESYLCPLNIEDVCRLQDIKEKVTALECESQSFICSLQASVRLSSSEKLIEYTTTLENKVNGSAFAFVEINNGTNQTAYINFVTRDQYGNIYDTHEVHSGSIKVGGIEYVNSAYDLGGSITIRLPNVRTLTDTYVTNVRLYHTDAGGIYTGQFADINVSPLSSPHLTGLYTVSAADLYFTSAS